MSLDYQQKTNALFSQQKKDWVLLQKNLEGLKTARIKEFQYKDFSIKVQFNPKRITSSAARVDSDSINKRQCFLCAANRPAEQREVLFEKDYEILTNPFPIFSRHYTIASTQHIPQKIEEEFSRMLDISKALPELVVFYNGPRCGASAPDHQHFQAGNLGFLPIEDEYDTLKREYGMIIHEDADFTATAIDDGLRRFIVLESHRREEIIKSFNQILRYTARLQKHEEAMMNILSFYREKWRVMVFLREKHRPWQFFEEGEKNILLSPAAVDLGGTLITPLEKDFTKITREDITDIFHQVSLSEADFNGLIDDLKQYHTNRNK